VFSIQAHWPEARVTLSGEAREFTRRGDEGYWGRFGFCPTCGSSVWYCIELRPGVISIPVGLFADPTFPEPRVSVFEERKHPWVVFATEGDVARE
jgi:hypothetical protein